MVQRNRTAKDVKDSNACSPDHHERSARGQSPMPSFAGKLSATDIGNLIAFLKNETINGGSFGSDRATLAVPIAPSLPCDETPLGRLWSDMRRSGRTQTHDTNAGSCFGDSCRGCNLRGSDRGSQPFCCPPQCDWGFSRKR